MSTTAIVIMLAVLAVGGIIWLVIYSDDAVRSTGKRPASNRLKLMENVVRADILSSPHS